VLKNNDQHLELIFLTGVSKCSKTGTFSGLNNLTDLTIRWTATFTGYWPDAALYGLIQLDYPNKEVRDSMLEHLIEDFTGVSVERD